MKANVLRAHAIYSLRPNILATIPIFDIFDALQEHYHFRDYPSNQMLLNPVPNQPVNFIWGKAILRDPSEYSIAIQMLQVQTFPSFATTVGIVTTTSTNDSDLVLTDLMGWVHKEFGIDTESIYPTSYQSQLEIWLSGSMGEQCPALDPAADLITEYVRDYGFLGSQRYQTTLVSMYVDSSQRTDPPTLSTNFTLERRAGTPFSENKYFSQAPLKTEDHKAVLELIDKTIRGSG